MSATAYKILFGVWLMVLVLNGIAFGVDVYNDSPDLDDLAFTVASAVICLQFWELWHVKTPIVTVNIIKMEE